VTAEECLGRPGPPLTLAIVRKRQGVHHFEVLPRRWVVERTFSWLGKCRRLAVDYERKSEHHQAWVQWAMVRVMVKRLTRQAPPLPKPNPQPRHGIRSQGLGADQNDG
jgi:hypothetical protein